MMSTHIRYRGFYGDIRQFTRPISFDAESMQAVLDLPGFREWREGGIMVSDSLGVLAVRKYFDPQLATFPHRQIAREALSNVVQHAQARRVLVSLQYEGEQIRLSVVDDGRGMQVGEVNGDGQTGHGIANMRARARLMGGDLFLASAPDRGTRAEVIVPCGAEEGYDG